MNININKNEIQLDKLQAQIFDYFWREANPENGLVSDRTTPDWPAGLGATGMALTGYPVAVNRGLIPRDLAAGRTLKTLRFFESSRSGSEPEATGYKGFYYRYLDKNKGRRSKICEISVLDTAILISGALTASMYFDGNSDVENEIRNIAEELYSRVDWQWAMNNEDTISAGWKPESGFIRRQWHGYDETLPVYILGLGSPTFPISENAYLNWCSSFEWITSFGFEYLYAGPLIVHQLPHIWFDLRGIQDEFMRTKEIDYYENTIRAVKLQHRYAIENPNRFDGYSRYFWGITESDGPGPATIEVKGQDRHFLGFARRGVPLGPDDGTVSPWAIVASLPFAPEEVMQSIDYLLHEPDLNICNSYGFKSAFNASLSHKPHIPHGWRSPWHYSMNQGPALALIENYRTGLIWDTFKRSTYIKEGLKRAGFSGGWLAEEPVYEFQENNHQDQI
jgi:hypothetical protein